ncbi:MAG: glycine cleavage system protein H [Halobacteriovoraceae bacterium]|nr:glycine cleavage system protein H [Halobacteriovoraceae bacterium]
MSHLFPSHLKFTEDHEWTELKSDIATVGITDFAQSALGDIVYIELPEAGTEVSKGDSFGVVESIKSVSDLYSPLSGTIVEVNMALEDSAEKINEAPYDSWIIKIKVSSTDELDSLLTSEGYKSHCEKNS